MFRSRILSLAIAAAACVAPLAPEEEGFEFDELDGRGAAQRRIEYGQQDAAGVLAAASGMGLKDCAACVCLAFHESAGVHQQFQPEYPLHNVCVAGGEDGHGCQRRSCCAGSRGVLECGSACDGSGDIGAFQIACNDRIRRCGVEVFSLEGNTRFGLELLLDGLRRLRAAGHWPASAWELDATAIELLGPQADTVRAIAEPEKRFLSAVYYQPGLACERGQRDQDHVFCRYARAWLDYYNVCSPATEERCRRRLAAFVRNAGSCFAQHFPQRVAPAR